MKFTSPPGRQDFHERVWELARMIPRGQVATYGQLALLVAPPAGIDAGGYKAYGARWVGGAMAACPDDVPWQRVINSQGKISQRPGAEEQRKLLEAEGVLFTNDRVDLRRYGWHGPSSGTEPRQETML